MPEPQFLVPLDHLVYIQKRNIRPAGGHAWECCFSHVYDRADAGGGFVSTQVEAVSAAVQHLSDAHGLIPARPAPDTEPEQFCSPSKAAIGTCTCPRHRPAPDTEAPSETEDLVEALRNEFKAERVYNARLAADLAARDTELAEARAEVERLTTAAEDTLDILGDRGNPGRGVSAVTVLRKALGGGSGE